jgi:C4-dicarboxylate transporter DctQ subunit
MSSADDQSRYMPAVMSDGIARAVERMLAWCFIAAVLLNFANVIDRYVFDRSILSADEIQVFLLVAMVFLGLPVVTWRRKHLRMDVVIDGCPPNIRLAARILETMVFLVAALFVCWESFLYTWDMYVLGRTSDMAGIPMWIPHSLVALGFGLSVLALMIRRFTRWSTHGTDAA